MYKGFCDAIEEYHRQENGKLQTWFRSRIWIHIDGRPVEPVEIGGRKGRHLSKNDAILFAQTYRRKQ